MNTLAKEILDILKNYKKNDQVVLSSDSIVNIKNKMLEKSKKININMDIHPITTDGESLTLELISLIISYHLFGYQVSPKQFLLLVQSINYHGLYGLIDLFNDIDISVFSIKDKFSYYKFIAKYYKDLGDFDKAKKHYLNAMEVAKKMEMLPYAFVLQSKLYSDYLLREGMAKTYCSLAYEMTISKYAHEEDKRWFQICLDTYAKDIYNSNPQKGDEIYEQIKSKYHKKYDSRVEFRYLESKIEHNLLCYKYDNLSGLFQEYENKLESIRNNPKAQYVRLLHLLRFYRRIQELPLSESGYLQRRLKDLKAGDAIYRLDECIDEAKIFRDRKFIALGYYEKSFWSEGDICESIDCLLNGLKIFHENKKSIINIIYTNIINRIATLYVHSRQWDLSLKYYRELYSYYSFVTIELEKEKNNIMSFIAGNKDTYLEAQSEFYYLNIDDLKKMNLSLLIDYENLSKRLLEYAANINLIQKQLVLEKEELMYNQGYIITHDLRKSLNNLRFIEKNIETKIQSDKNSYLKNLYNSLRIENSNLERNISSYEDSLKIDSNINKIDLIKEVDDYLSLLSKNYKSEIQFIFNTANKLLAKFHTFDITRLVENLVSNIIYIGIKNGVKNLTVRFELILKFNIIYLNCVDNCGDYDSFAVVIDKLNGNERVIMSQKNSNKIGQGLLGVKKLLKKYNVEEKWILLGSDNEKHLSIPLVYSYDEK